MINSKYSALYFSFSTGHCKSVEMKKEKEEKNPNKKNLIKEEMWGARWSTCCLLHVPRFPLFS